MIKTVSLQNIPYSVDEWFLSQFPTNWRPFFHADFKIPILHTGDAEKLVVLANCPWEVSIENERYSGIIPLGMITDLASVPKIFRSYLERDGRHTRAALVHDDLYATERFERKLADLIFYKLLQIDRVPTLKAKLMYHTVSALGGVVWDKHTKESISEARRLHAYLGNPFNIPSTEAYFGD